ncbi:hypothetical protein QFC22_002164 [Naganishia vaughanmartiniae]|uniref:Uncharacterized protein n=1 Tax=Naganishia vaughanmartiniae TaxID=1424756 RepID=A0ACC2XDU4_9TREE|nr:hypothetical protein QFC22_002164 [Naganishia vaughanmartiniae]
MASAKLQELVNSGKQSAEDAITSLANQVSSLSAKVTSEAESEAHQLRWWSLVQKRDEETVPGIVHPGATGVIYCTDRAQANGFSYDNPEWANMGQGAPETGDLPGGPLRIRQIDLRPWGDGVNEYAPTTGVKELRQAVADYYNREYRVGKKSQYTFENVCITPGGRAGMARVAAVIGDCYTNYQIPEYTTYSEILSVFKNLVPVPTTLHASDQYKLHVDLLRKEMEDMSVSVIIASNPRNPTGQAIAGKDLENLVALSRERVTLVMDEFYSWYQYPDDPKDLGTSLSAAEYVEDVEDDSVVIINGLTKGWRLPGWRVAWVVGPKSVVSAISQSGSFLDGGASHMSQLAAIPLLEHNRVQQEKISLQKAFRIKRDYMLSRLKKMGLEVKIPPQATFYIWLDLSGLEEPLNNGLAFFEELLKEKAICVPGIFFDINPAKRRDLFHSPCHHFVRLSFGPRQDQLEKGMDAIERMLAKHKHSAHLMGKK